VPDFELSLENTARLAKIQRWVGRQFAAHYQTTSYPLRCLGPASPVEN
jgi:hypothetical protein